MKLLTRDEFNQYYKQLRFINDELVLLINGRKWYLVELNDTMGAIVNEQERQELVKKRIERNERRYNERQTKYIDIDIKIKLSLTGFKQWCTIERVHTYLDRPTRFYKVTNRNGDFTVLYVTKAPTFANHTRILNDFNIVKIKRV